jgi:hypothetical protein
MARNAFSVTESIVHAPSGNGSGYPYRAGLGMVPSAEFAVFFDDFGQKVTTNVPTGWEAAIIDTGATVTTYTTVVAGTQGVIQLTDANLSEGAAIYLPRSVVLTAGKKFFMEARVFTDDVTDNALQMGLAVLTATTNPEDLWTTAQDSFATFGIVDASAALVLTTDKANVGPSSTTGSRSLTASTWSVLGIGWDGSTLKGYLDGQEVASTQTRVPTDLLLAPFIGHINGNGAGGNTVLVDFVRYAVER